MSIVSTPPPTIVSPANGTVTNRPSVTVSGTGAAGATVTIYDATSDATNHVSTTVKSNGKFSATAASSDGVNTHFATQDANGISPESGVVVINGLPARKF